MAAPPESGDRGAPRLGRLAGLFLVSCGLLLFEIALTKIFSIVLWYHFGFLVISIALLGFAMAGVSLARRPERLAAGGAWLARLAGAAGLAACGAVWLIAHTQADAFSIIADRNEGGLVFMIAVLLVPMFLLGLAISAAMTLERGRAGSAYAANLLGSGAGCAAAIALFDGLHLSAPGAVLAAGGLMAAGGIAFALESGARAAWLPLVAGLVALAALAWDGRERALHLVAPKSKPLYHVESWDREKGARAVELADGKRVVFTDYRIDGDDAVLRTPYGDELRVALDLVPRDARGQVALAPQSLVEFTEWTSLSRVDAFSWPAELPPWGLWGLSDAYQGPRPQQKGITIDSWAMTNVMRWDGGERGEPGEPPEILEYLPASLVHRVRPGAEILCIGAGGGMDLLTAKRFGARRIVGVEINPGVVRAARAVGEFQGRLYEPGRNPEVELHVAEGRHWLERDSSLYDVVQLSGVDTAITTQAGAFSLSENFLYTAEAFDTYLGHVKPGGLVTLTRWYLPDQAGFPREDLRLFVLAIEALARAGVERPERCAYLVQSKNFVVILFGRQELNEAELAALDRTCDSMGFAQLYHPTRDTPLVNPFTQQPTANHYEAFARAEDQRAWLAAYPYDVASPTDDRPFFFEVSRFEHVLARDSFFNSLGGITAHGILTILLGLALVAGWFFVVQPLRRLSMASSSVARGPLVLYFACLGLGFILVEVMLSQKFNLFLGNPLYALAVVLASVLVFSGVGAALSTRVGDPRRAIAVVVAIAVVYPFVLDTIFDAALALETPARIAVAVGLLAPLAVAMGMPFPLGLGRLAAADPALSAWAWGVNGYLSVVGSVLAVVLAIALGFSAVIWIGAGVYALAWLVAPRVGR
jgi:hypothetical protein